MSKGLKSALKYLGYTCFFVFAATCFVYLTLPLEEVQAYLERKAGDEYNMDLEIVDLDTWGIGGIELTGVTLKPRPTAKQLEEIADSFQGVNKAYAMQAGREIRIMVEPTEITDNEASLLAREVSKKIENDVQYPGQIKITVCRETRAVEYAK